MFYFSLTMCSVNVVKVAQGDGAGWHVGRWCCEKCQQWVQSDWSELVWSGLLTRRRTSEKIQQKMLMLLVLLSESLLTSYFYRI